jgi:hypothetical protein
LLVQERVGKLKPEQKDFLYFEDVMAMNRKDNFRIYLHLGCTLIPFYWSNPSPNRPLPNTPYFSLEYGGSMFFRYVGILPKYYRAQQPRRP